MADFQQNGNIAQFHNLRTRPLEELEYRLETFAQVRKITLILPSLFSELEGPALGNILKELSKVKYLHRIIIGLDAADEAQFRHAREFFSVLPQNHVVIWNDGPRVRAIMDRLEPLGIGPIEPGKGRNVWGCIGYLIACADSAVMAIHDCDIVTYERGMLSRLVYPVVHPAFPYHLSKGFYPRIGNNRMGGRVTRNLVSPLLIALKKVLGDRDYIDYLRAFRYPLSGEFAMRTATLPDLRMPADWGLEIGILSEAWRNMGPRAVCQVEIADIYDHKHQDLSAEDAQAGLNRMSLDICKAIFRKLAADGTVFSPNIFRTLKATYHRRALDLLDVYSHDAMMNGLVFERHSEETSIAMFAENIMQAGQMFLDNPQELPFIPNWNLVHAADPTLLSDFRAAVAADMADTE
ncbi:glycosyltransferase family protein [Paenirhodobacter populi]|uniref:Glycosyl transferase n=1 Tax=Paenirhodobacter populi TaxID=2306993 RepID=A0A443K5K0_9RHOB|nr:glycosyl transferase [Sinirhodobacter populi]RWR06874.1 glycosyl transferase [Sinirhodobacter populi]RWR28057.1 glycosyl transferase [Sinirhodobacter populi]RWR34442.1 glycosyl transferase [Sinirhodobacter populi]